MTAATLMLALAWATATLVVAHRAAVVPRGRVQDLLIHRPDAEPGRARRPNRRGPMTTVGRALRRLAGRSADPVADRRAGRALVGALALLPFAPPLAALPVGWAVVAPVVRARRAERSREVAVVDQLPDLVDLLTLTTDAGLPVTAALAAIGDRPGGPLGEAVGNAARHVDRGGTTAGALSPLAEEGGPAVRSVVDALAEHDRYGTPLRPALVQAGIEARMRRRRQAEETARRLPVTLLFPLVLTTLPAFFLLAIVPLLAGSLGSLSP